MSYSEPNGCKLLYQYFILIKTFCLFLSKFSEEFKWLAINSGICMHFNIVDYINNNSNLNTVQCLSLLIGYKLIIINFMCASW